MRKRPRARELGPPPEFREAMAAARAVLDWAVLVAPVVQAAPAARAVLDREVLVASAAPVALAALGAQVALGVVVALPALQVAAPAALPVWATTLPARAA